MILRTFTFIIELVVAYLCHLVLRKQPPTRRMTEGAAIRRGSLRTFALLMAITILVPVSGMLYAQEISTKSPPIPGDDLLPGVLQPWSVSMPDKSKLQALGATMADAQAFSQKLRAIAEVVTQAPGYNPLPAGCDIQISGEVGLVINKTTKKLRRFSGSLLIGCIPFDVEVRDGKKVRGGHGETRHFVITINDPNMIAHGSSWSDEEGEFFTQPERTGEFRGMPVYSGVNEYYPNKFGGSTIVVAMPGQPRFRPVGRERALKAFIANIFLDKYPQLPNRERALKEFIAGVGEERVYMPEYAHSAQQMLAALTPEQRTEAACYYTLDRVERSSGTSASAYPGIKERGITPAGVKDCIPIVQESMMNNDLPPTAVQLIVFSMYRDILLHGKNARKKGETPAFFFEVTATALRNMDWGKLQAMLE
jgi:hypothetical protein